MAQSLTRRFVPAAILACILAIYIFNVERWHPEFFFGRTHDDSLYFSSAQALAEHRGYIIASFPGAPAQTKYPILFPWLLQWVWKWNPSFPSNLKSAIHLTEFFGCWALIASFFLFRKLLGIGNAAACILVGVLAFQSMFVRMSGLIMSDVPFMALLLAAYALAGDALRPAGRWRDAALLGAIVGMSFGLRSIAIAAIVGFLLVGLWRRAFRQSTIFCATVGLVGGGIMFATRLANGNAPQLDPSGGGLGWQQLAAYYSGYLKFWPIAVPSAHALLALAKANALYLISAPGSYLATPFVNRGPLVSALLTVLILVGLWRQKRDARWQPVLAVSALYCAILVVWPWSPERFLLPLLPIFLAALVVELKRIVPMIRKRIASGNPFVERSIAAVMSLALIAPLMMAFWDFAVRDPHRATDSAKSQAANLAQREEAYCWIRKSTPADARIVAYEDAVLYLYTQRQSLRPIAFSVEFGYLNDRSALQRDFDHFFDAATHVEATYWLATDDDYHEELGADEIRSRTQQLEAKMTTVLRSTDGSVRVHEHSRTNEP